MPLPHLTKNGILNVSYFLSPRFITGTKKVAAA
nr:MAG TPA: hypothetical protein [Caudoviricetes sp.]